MPNRGTNDFQVDGQNDEKTVWKIVADTLLIPMEFINSELSYQSVMQWDSMGHVNLMLAIEKNFDVKIGQDQVLELTSVSEIVSYISKCSTSNFSQKNSIKDNEKSNIIHRGLTNIYFDESEITFIDAKNGKLFHRGYSIDDLVKQASYEEVAYLLIYSDLPNKKATNVLRTITSHLSETLADLSVEDQGIAYIAKIPTIIGTYLAFKNNKDLPQPPEKLSQAAYLLFMLLGKIPETDVIRIFEQNMILQAEHDSNASTFAARITTSTEAELGNAITSAIATFSGCLHGGALLGVVQMLQEMHDANEVKSYIQNRLKKKAPIFGFGHRVYRTEDPRAKPLKENAKILSEKYCNARLLEILEAVKAEMSGYIEHGINVNVDFYACISYLLMGLEKDMLVPIFIANRSCGWVAHIIEQKNKNILLRPRLQYTGDIKDKFIEIEQRA